MSMRKGSFYILFLGCLLGLAACLDEREPDILAPELEIGEATGITRNAAHVNGFVRLQGEGAVAACHFVCDTTPALAGGRRVEADALTGEVGANLDSLKAGTDYYYCGAEHEAGFGGDGTGQQGAHDGGFGQPVVG